MTVRRVSRKPKAGFPVTSKFQTSEELEKYLTEDPESIVCLLCGRRFKALNSHMQRVHGISVREYKIQFGIPITRGAASLNWLERNTEIGLEFMSIAEHAAKKGNLSPNKGKKHIRPAVTKNDDKEFSKKRSREKTNGRFAKCAS